MKFRTAISYERQSWEAEIIDETEVKQGRRRRKQSFVKRKPCWVEGIVSSRQAKFGRRERGNTGGSHSEESSDEPDSDVCGGNCIKDLYFVQRIQ